MSVRNPTERARPRRCYTVPELLRDLEISRSSFFDLLKRGQLPFLEELLPRIGGRRRFKAGPVDDYYQNRWRGPR